MLVNKEMAERQFANLDPFHRHSFSTDGSTSSGLFRWSLLYKYYRAEYKEGVPWMGSVLWKQVSLSCFFLWLIPINTLLASSMVDSIVNHPSHFQCPRIDHRQPWRFSTLLAQSLSPLFHVRGQIRGFYSDNHEVYQAYWITTSKVWLAISNFISETS